MFVYFSISEVVEEFMRRTISAIHNADDRCLQEYLILVLYNDVHPDNSLTISRRLTHKFEHKHHILYQRDISSKFPKCINTKISVLTPYFIWGSADNMFLSRYTCCNVFVVGYILPDRVYILYIQNVFSCQIIFSVVYSVIQVKTVSCSREYNNNQYNIYLSLTV